MSETTTPLSEAERVELRQWIEEMVKALPCAPHSVKVLRLFDERDDLAESLRIAQQTRRNLAASYDQLQDERLTLKTKLGNADLVNKRQRTRILTLEAAVESAAKDNYFIAPADFADNGASIMGLVTRLETERNKVRAQLAAVEAERERLKALSHRLAAWVIEARDDITDSGLVQVADQILTDARAALAPPVAPGEEREGGRMNDPAALPTFCPDGHELMWLCEHHASCAGSNDHPPMEFSRSSLAMGCAMAPESARLHWWECRVGSLIGTTEPAEAAQRLEALIAAVRSVTESYRGTPAYDVEIADLETALAPLPKVTP